MDQEGSDAASINAAAVANDIMSLPNGGTYTFAGEPDDTITLNISDGNDRIIDGNSLSMPAISGRLHFAITNTGSGTITFKNMTLTNPGSYASSGGIGITGGKYVFENCLFSGLTNTAVVFNGNTNSADFNGCTFNGNVRGILLSPGNASYNAKFNIDNCFFNNNIMSSSINEARGAAIHVKSAEQVSVKISCSAFTGNEVRGTSTVSAGNNRVDGGAIALDVPKYGGLRNTVLEICDSYFEDNFAQDDGGAISIDGYQYATAVKSSIWNCTFTGNKAAGATYYAKMVITAGITNGSGGAIVYYGLTDSSISNSTFYNNGITNGYTGAGTNCGNVGGGGAVAVDTDDSILDPAVLPPVPILSNNIFVGNYVNKSVNKTTPVLGVDLEARFGVKATGYTGNVYVNSGADADRQNTATVARPLTNNGNIGYDNGALQADGITPVYDIASPGKGLLGITSYANDLGISTANKITVGNIFIMDSGLPVKKTLGNPIGAGSDMGQRYYYLPSPTSDELYRDGSGPYFDSAHGATDSLGNSRDAFPSAGTVEIHWTKFNPGANGGWSSVPTQIGNPADAAESYYVVKSLNFATNGIYYVVTDKGLPSPKIAAMPRTALVPDSAQYGFAGWRSSHPDMGWWDQVWADANGVTEKTVADYLLAHPMTDLPQDAFPLYQPGALVPSVKQTLTAEWNSNKYRVDFSLNYPDPPAHQTAEDNFWLPGISDITQGGYDSAGSAIIAPPYVGVLFGDHILQPKADPIRAGCMFKGWYRDPGLQNAWDFSSDTISGDTVIYAKWAMCRSVVFHSTDGAFITAGDTAEIQQIEIGSLIPRPGTAPAVPVPTYGGYVIAGWYVGDEFGEYTTARIWSFGYDVLAAPDPPTIPYVALHLYAEWTVAIIEHIITADSDADSDISPRGSISVSAGDDITFVFSAKPGYLISA
ncbi:MAG: InlB B-repeat-containing protein, partial [Candidatus Methanoplasma sp.]|nr:InlB B-repeat-containing protein [Candidatus Methanoplasma sp.]